MKLITPYTKSLLTPTCRGLEWTDADPSRSSAEPLCRMGSDQWDLVLRTVGGVNRRGVLTLGYSHVLAEEGTHGFELLHKPYAAEELSAILRRLARSPK